MRIRMLVDLVGHWAGADGTHHEWPPHGDELELEDWMGAEVVRQGHGVEVQAPVPVREPKHVETVAADPIENINDKTEG